MNTARTTKVTILTFHSIDTSGSVISTAPGTFRNQMKFLSEMNFNVVSLKTLGKHFLKKKPLPPKTIVLTFDDGFHNFYTTAFPVLSEYDFTATVFLITDYCGKFNDWSGNLSSLEPSKLMDWSEIKELNNNGIEFAAHSRTHLDLTRISIEEARREMVESKSAIENNLGIEVTDFAYPYGKYNAQVKSLTEEHFRTACSVRLGKTQFGDDLFSLKRVDAYYLSNERIFRSILSANFDWYMSLRQAMRDLKAACYSK